MKIAIYGGAFNPVHNEHVNIVRAAKKFLELDKIIIVPTFKSPHKNGTLIARAKDRIEMCRLAFKDIEGAEISDYEVKRGGGSYSYVTCRHFKKIYENDELYFIIGADMLESFAVWREPEEILKCVTLAVCAREKEEALKAEIRKYVNRFKSEIVDFGYVGGAVSSTEARSLSAVGEDFRGYVPEKVRLYIRNNKIYEIPGIVKVKNYLTDERWKHTLGVVVTAAEHCRKEGIFEEDAVIAAALHDCAKYLGNGSAELKGFVAPQNVPAAVIHQYAGAYVAEHTFGIKDEAILNAIRYHTSGRENMSKLEKLIFLSDLLEKGRNFEGVEKLREVFESNIDKCMLLALEQQLNYLESQGKPVYPLTRRAYNYLKEKGI